MAFRIRWTIPAANDFDNLARKIEEKSDLIEALFTQVETSLKQYQPALDDLEARCLGRTLWGSVHGLVQLGLNERLGYWQGQQLKVDELLDQLMSTVLAGLRHREAVT